MSQRQQLTNRQHEQLVPPYCRPRNRVRPCGILVTNRTQVDSVLRVTPPPRATHPPKKKPSKKKPFLSDLFLFISLFLGVPSAVALNVSVHAGITALDLQSCRLSWPLVSWLNNATLAELQLPDPSVITSFT